jgi:hypothetical protein
LRSIDHLTPGAGDGGQPRSARPEDGDFTDPNVVPTIWPVH